jgi:hypothetical protein
MLQWQQSGRLDPAARFEWPADGVVSGPLALPWLRRFSTLAHYARHVAPHLLPAPAPAPALPMPTASAAGEGGAPCSDARDGDARGGDARGGGPEAQKPEAAEAGGGRLPEAAGGAGGGLAAEGAGGGWVAGSEQRRSVAALYRAAGRGWACVVAALLRAGVDPDGYLGPPPAGGAGPAAAAECLRRGRMTTPLHVAAAAGHAAAVRALLRGGARARVGNGGGALAVHLAAGAGGDVLDALLQAEAADGAVRARDANRQTVLHYAARSGRADCIRLLAGRGGDVMRDVDGVDKWNRQVRAASMPSLWRARVCDSAPAVWCGRAD